ncbi:DUF5926 family protein [Cellulomonas aerilata]|uniref:DUF5926 domain-containing protein n=1 Tax=Cellulomonas aerilata TaxID=515326 RepID=A0A512D794_9CELL|nr:DUF5926 family protein [Cellulomonas aerilata]GEO32354.1 hypothetical protein CAE01nite_00790 [Cellulomonas aerilata]
MAKKPSVAFVLRPFDGLPGEPDWVAMREVVPAATATVRTTAEHGSRDVVVTTVLPEGWPALHRADGQVMVALQTSTGSGDASRDVATALLAALELEPGTPVTSTGLPTPGPRLQDVLDLSVPFTVTVHESYDYWLTPDTERTTDVQASLDEARETIIPTRKLASVESAYWCRMGEREYLRWAMPHDEQAMVDALARLHAARQSAIGDARFIGYFRSSGVVVPVWELVPGTGADALEQPAEEFEARFAEALADPSPLDANARRARAGLVSRQVTLR